MGFGVEIARDCGWKDVPDCSRCGGADPEIRRNWGCDEPAVSPVWDIECSCDGAGCEECDGEGRRAMYRCPGSMLREAEQSTVRAIGKAMRAYGFLDAHGILPAPGSLSEQSASFLEFVGLVGRERGDWEAKRREEMRSRSGGQ